MTALPPLTGIDVGLIGTPDFCRRLGSALMTRRTGVRLHTAGYAEACLVKSFLADGSRHHPVKASIETGVHGGVDPARRGPRRGDADFSGRPRGLFLRGRIPVDHGIGRPTPAFGHPSGGGEQEGNPLLWRGARRAGWVVCPRTRHGEPVGAALFSEDRFGPDENQLEAGRPAMSISGLERDFRSDSVDVPERYSDADGFLHGPAVRKL